MKAFVLVCALVAGASASSFSFKNCGTEEYLSLNKVDVRGKIAFPSSLELDVEAVVNKDIPANSTITMNVFRVVNVFGERRMRIPCVGKAGSCTYNLCKFIAKKTDPNEPKFDLCSLWPQDAKCGCPVKGGLTIAKKGAKMTLPKLPSIAKLLAKGKYFVKAEVNDPMGNQVSCFEINTQIG